jgi:hypothetical protein
VWVAAWIGVPTGRIGSAPSLSGVRYGAVPLPTDVGVALAPPIATI